MRNPWKKKIVKFASAATMLVLMVFTLTACGQDISGKYVSEVQMKDFMNEDDLADLDEMADMGLGFMGDIPLNMELVLNEDKTFSLTMELKDMESGIVDGIKENADAILQNMFEEEGITEDMYDEIAEASGYEDYEAMKEDLISELQQDLESSMSEWDGELDDLQMSGSYSVKGNEVIFTDAEDENNVDSAELMEDGTIKMTWEDDGIAGEFIFRKAAE